MRTGGVEGIVFQEAGFEMIAQQNLSSFTLPIFGFFVIRISNASLYSPLEYFKLFILNVYLFAYYYNNFFTQTQQKNRGSIIIYIGRAEFLLKNPAAHVPCECIRLVYEY